MPHNHIPVPCSECGSVEKHITKGLCKRCYGRDQTRRYRAASPELRQRGREAAKAYWAAHREEKRAYDAAYYEAHPEVYRAYALAHREMGRKKAATYRAKHPEKVEEGKLRLLAFMKANPEINCEASHVYRARVSAAFVERVDWYFCWVRQGGICTWCHETLEWKQVCRDHIWPLHPRSGIRGTHEQRNAQVLHLSCNCKKSNTGSGQLWLF